jgi:hypothetical protein
MFSIDMTLKYAYPSHTLLLRIDFWPLNQDKACSLEESYQIRQYLSYCIRKKLLPLSSYYLAIASIWDEDQESINMNTRLDHGRFNFHYHHNLNLRE